ncbi:hypothetical protein QW060_27715 [Myroides ceti]|uniref:Uncharacterized protein n=1 Tax=Paenimyroides ceti TaxID=395087 RepID=A0ABT8D3R0_9FLAO|nr:hypothetical protein [Paenimyroides ceti]MDN3710573.1 hypothetical protein [Paenimyroides ceti]
MRFYLEPYSATFPMNNVYLVLTESSLSSRPSNLTYTALGYEIIQSIRDRTD